MVLFHVIRRLTFVTKLSEKHRLNLLIFMIGFLLSTAGQAGALKCVLSKEQIKLRQSACHMSLTTDQCESFKPTEYLKTCSEDEVTDIWPNDPLTIMQVCYRGAVDSFADFFAWLDRTMTTASHQIGDKVHLLQACDLPCKRRLAQGVPEFAKMKDAHLQKINAAYIEEKVRVLNNSKMNFEQLERARQFDKVRDPRILAEAARRENSGNISEDEAKRMATSLMGLAQAALKNEVKRFQCYQPQFYPEMLCYGLATVLDPVTSTALLLKSVRLKKILAGQSGSLADSRKIEVAESSKNGIKREGLEREVFIQQNLDKKFATVEQNRAWISAVDAEAPRKGSQVLDVENSVLQKLNNVTKDKNLVTSMTNKHKEILANKLSEIGKKYQNQVDMLPYSDFKSQRWLMRPKSPLTELPKELQQDLAQALKSANKELELNLRQNGIIRDSDKASDWFRGGLGESADEANLAVRASREMSSNELRVFKESEVQENLGVFLQWAELKRKDVAQDLAGTPLLGATSKNIAVPSEAVFDSVRKISDNESLREALVKKFAGASKDEQEKMARHLTDARLNHLRDYAELVGQFSPGLRTAERAVASIQGAELGGMTADFAGMGAKNLRATAEALSSAKELKEAVVESRRWEKTVTATFNRDKAEFEGIVSKYMKSTVASGDDFAAVAGSALTADKKQKMLSELATLREPAGARISFIGSGVVPMERNQLAAHGEAIEKILRSNLSGAIPERKLRQVVFATDMQGRTLGSGSIELLIGESPAAGLTSAEKVRIKDEFKRAVMEFNAKPDGALSSKVYAPQ